MISMQVYLPERVHKALDLRAKQENKSRTQVIREVLREEIKERLRNAS